MTVRIAVGRFFHESHGFHPQPTTANDITVVRGDDILTRARGTASTLAGVLDVFESTENVELVPISDVEHGPSGLIDHAFYLAERDYWCERIGVLKPDAIALDLHGAMSTTECVDADGDFLAHLRRSAGDQSIIGCGLDLHANMTPSMLESADVCIACKQNPHIDFRETGQKVATLLLEVMRGSVDPVYTMAKARAIYTGKYLTSEEPLKGMHARARELEVSHSSIEDISLCNVFRLNDAEDMGESAVVLSNGHSALAGEVALAFAQEFWDRRKEFHEDYLTIQQALDEIAVHRSGEGGPIVLADLGDRTLAGAPGDSTLVLQGALHHDYDFTAAMTVNDVETAELAHAKGVGAELSFSLGGKITAQFRPFKVSAVVARLYDDDVTFKGPVHAGLKASMGRSAVIVIADRLQVIVTSTSCRVHDPNIYEQRGIVIADQDFVVVKSGQHFSVNFADIAEPMFVGSPGIGHYIPGMFPRTRSRVWPEQDVSNAPLMPVQVFSRASPAAGEMTHGQIRGVPHEG